MDKRLEQKRFEIRLTFNNKNHSDQDVVRATGTAGEVTTFVPFKGVRVRFTEAHLLLFLTASLLHFNHFLNTFKENKQKRFGFVISALFIEHNSIIQQFNNNLICLIIITHP